MINFIKDNLKFKEYKMIKIKFHSGTKEFKTREEAYRFIIDCYNCSEGSEQRTYAEVWHQLDKGFTECEEDYRGY